MQEGNKRVKYEFTYLDYLYYCDRETWKKMVNGECSVNNEEGNFLYVKEDSEAYATMKSKKLCKKTGDKKHDKIFKDILQNKDEIADFISEFVKYKVKAEELEIYNPNYITKEYEYKNADIVYKIKGKELYFLIEHQTKVDYSMSYRILNYILEIIRSVVQGKEINRVKYRYPRIVPIVLYTGNKEWTSSNSFANIQDGESKGYIDKIDVRYKLVDVNQYKLEEFLKQNTMLTNVMMLEKCKSNKEVLTCLGKIRKNTDDNKQLQKLKRIVSYLYENEDERTLKEIIKILDESESERNMSTIAERIGKELANERRAAKVEGVFQGVKQIVEQMVKMNFEDAIIKEVTGAKESEIAKIRKEMSKNQ